MIMMDKPMTVGDLRDNLRQFDDDLIVGFSYLINDDYHDNEEEIQFVKDLKISPFKRYLGDPQFKMDKDGNWNGEPQFIVKMS